jgi:hypothetical protein
MPTEGDEKGCSMPEKVSAPPITGRYDWESIKRRLRRKPDEWVLAHEQVNRGLVSAVNGGRIATLRDDPRWAYEAITRNTRGSLADIYMRASAKTEQEQG